MTDSKNPIVDLKTSLGTISLELYPEKAPETVNNFLQYVDEKHYDGTIFHRVIPNFMIQGGGFDENMQQLETHDSIKNEADNGLMNQTGTIAMARTMDPHSATAQFFINVSDNAFLNHSVPTQAGWGYCVFGKVIDGIEVVHAIENVPTGQQGYYEDVPEKTIVIEQATRRDA